MRIALASFVAAGLACGSARAIGTPTNLGQAQGAAVTSQAITTTADAPVGNLNIVAVQAHGEAITSVMDQVGNAYTACPASYVVGGDRVALYYSIVATDLPAGDTITTTLASSTNAKLNVAALTVSGARSTATCDISGSGATGTGSGAIAGPSTGTLTAQPEMVVGLIYIASDTADTFTQPSGWTGLTKSGSSPSGGTLQWGYDVVTSTASLSYSPTLGTSRTWVANVGSFFDASRSLPAGTGTRMGLTGIGH